MIIFIVILIFMGVALAVAGLGWFILGRKRAPTHRLKQAKAAVALRNEEDSVAALAERLARPLNRIAPPSLAEANKLQKQLMMAGYVSRRAPLIFRGIQ